MVKVDWRLVVCGTNHKSSGLEQREALQIGAEDIARAHAELAQIAGVLEATIISTCNRIEFYLVAELPHHSFDIVTEFYRRFREIDITPQRDVFYVHRGKHAADHLFRVAAGIDSMVLGENQIQGQIKDAYTSACAVKIAGKIIHRLFHHAFRIGKQVRTDTEMGRGACSVSSAATDLLKSNLDKSARPIALPTKPRSWPKSSTARASASTGCRICSARRTS